MWLVISTFTTYDEIVSLLTFDSVGTYIVYIYMCDKWTLEQLEVVRYRPSIVDPVTCTTGMNL